MKTSVKKRIAFARSYATHLLDQAGVDPNRVMVVAAKRSNRRVHVVVMELPRGYNQPNAFARWTWKAGDSTNTAKHVIQSMVDQMAEWTAKTK